MRQFILILLISLTLPAMAQSVQPNKSDKSAQPKNLIPLPEIPEPPPLPSDISPDPELEPQVTIKKRGEDTIEEYRKNGELYMIKVIPRIGPPYYLVKNRSRGMDAHPDDVGINVSPPMWRLLEF